MLNLRVEGPDGLCATLRSAGIDVITKPESDMPSVGRFARNHDPEGSPIELWQPASPGQEDGPRTMSLWSPPFCMQAPGKV